MLCFAVLLLNTLLGSQSLSFHFIFYTKDLICLSQKGIGYRPNCYLNIGIVKEFPYRYILKNNECDEDGINSYFMRWGWTETGAVSVTWWDKK